MPWPFEDTTDSAANAPGIGEQNQNLWGMLGGGMFSPSSIMNDPGFRRQAAYDALTNAGLGLIQASSPSPVPMDFGTAFGALAGGAAHGVQGSLDRYLKMGMAGAQMRNLAMQNQAYQQVLKNPAAPYDPYGGSQPQQAGGGTTPAPAPAGGTVPDNVTTQGAPMVGYLQEKYGLSPVAAAAVVGNLGWESGLNPNASHDGGTGYGMAGWDPQRTAGLKAFAEANGTSASDPKTQLDYVMQEFKSGDMGAQRAGAMLQTAKTPAEATTALMHFFRPQGYTPNNPSGGHGFVNRVQYSGALVPGQAAPQGPQVAQGDNPGAVTQVGDTQSAMPPFPVNPPDKSKYANLEMLGGPFKARAEAMYEADKRKYEAAKSLWESQMKQRSDVREQQGLELRRQAEERAAQQAAVGPNGRPQLGPIQAAAEKKKAEIEAEEKGRTNALFGGSLTGPPEELRQRVNPELLAVTESVQAGRTPMKDVNTTRTGGGISFGKNDVQALGEKLYGDKFNPSAGNIREQFEQNIKDSNHPSGKLLQSVNVVYKHMDQWQDLFLKIGNSDSPAWNQVRRWLKDNTGKSDYTTPESLSHAVGTEIANVIKGQQLNMPEVEAAVQTLSTVQSPEQAVRAIGALRHAMGARQETLEEDARDAYVPEERVQKLLKPSARAAIDHFDQVQKGFGTLMEGRDALKKGVPRAAVIERLKSMGVDPEGL